MVLNSIKRITDILFLPLTESFFTNSDFKIKFKKNGGFDIKENKEIYRAVASKKIIFNLDEVNIIFKKLFLDSDEKYLLDNADISNLFKYYSKLFKSFITIRNGVFCFKYWSSETEGVGHFGQYEGISKIKLWSYITKCISNDLIFILYLVYNAYDDSNIAVFSDYLKLEDMQLEYILRKGISETHLHFSANLNFNILWEYYIELRIENSEFKREILNFEEDFEEKLKKMAIVRLFLSKFLLEKLNYFYEEENKFNLLEIFKNDNCKILELNSSELLELKLIISSVLYDKKVERFISYRYFYKKLKSKWKIKETSFNRLNFTQDDDIGFEKLFLYNSIKYIKNMKNENDDKDFKRLFYKYLVFKNNFYAKSVEKYNVKGLDYFREYFSISTGIKYKELKKYYKTLFKQSFSDENLRKVEYRISPPKYERSMYRNYVKKLKSILSAYLEIYDERKEKGLRVPQFGLIYHFIKSECKNSFDCDKGICYKKFDKNKNSTYKKLHYGENRKEYIEQIETLKKVMENIDEASKLIVGIDAASSEVSTDPWVLTPVYLKARDSNDKIIGKNNKRINSLKFTYHVGEEFRHLITGVRHIDEVIEHMKYLSGDRIGHGIALGVEVEKWKVDNPVIMLTQVELLENYLWIWGLYRNDYINSKLDINYLEKKIVKISKDIFGHNKFLIFDLWEAYNRKFSENFDILSKTNECYFDQNLKNNNIKDESDVEKIILAYNCSKILKKMNKITSLKIDEFEVSLIKFSQKYVLSKIMRKGIIVETNPTSNSVIGEINEILEQHIIKLNNRYNRNVVEDNSVIVTINSDDPSVFNTNLSAEYAYVYYSLLEKGYSKLDILEWIDKIRINGMNTSFIPYFETEEEFKNTVKKVKDDIVNTFL